MEAMLRDLLRAYKEGTMESWMPRLKCCFVTEINLSETVTSYSCSSVRLAFVILSLAYMIVQSLGNT